MQICQIKKLLLGKLFCNPKVEMMFGDDSVIMSPQGNLDIHLFLLLLPLLCSDLSYLSNLIYFKLAT